MTPDQIARWALDSGFDPFEYLGGYAPQFERFAHLVAQHERERCAAIVEKYTGAWSDEGFALAQAIRGKK